MESTVVMMAGASKGAPISSAELFSVNECRDEGCVPAYATEWADKSILVMIGEAVEMRRSREELDEL